MSVEVETGAPAGVETDGATESPVRQKSLTIGAVCKQLVRELEEYGVIKGQRQDGDVFYDDTEKEIIRAVTELSRFGVGGRNLRVFRTSADREAALLEQILAPALRSRNPERRKEAVEALENLAAIASHLKYLLLVRDLRKLTVGS